MNKKWIDKNGNFWDGISIVLNGMRIWNPSDEQLIAAGYTEYVEPEPTPEELLAKAKQQKIVDIVNYDQSEAVNNFTIGNMTMWLNVEEREQIATQISANEAVGRTEMTRWFNGMAFTFTMTQWKQMLISLEVYAGDALNVTEAHKSAVEVMDDIEDIQNFDITQGYPEKLAF